MDTLQPIGSLVQARGIDKKELQPDRHWTKPWPQGPTDNGEDDEKVLHLSPEQIKAELKKKEELKYPNVRPAVRGQWPYGRDVDEHGHVSEWGKLDDGTDDDTVINAAIGEEGISMDHFRI